MVIVKIMQFNMEYNILLTKLYRIINNSMSFTNSILTIHDVVYSYSYRLCADVLKILFIHFYSEI